MTTISSSTRLKTLRKLSAGGLFLYLSSWLLKGGLSWDRTGAEIRSLLWTISWEITQVSRTVLSWTLPYVTWICLFSSALWEDWLQLEEEALSKQNPVYSGMIVKFSVATEAWVVYAPWNQQQPLRAVGEWWEEAAQMKLISSSIRFCRVDTKSGPWVLGRLSVCVGLVKYC